MKKNVGSQIISAQMISSTDGSNVTTGTCNVAVEIDGTPGTGGTATHIANGKWEYAPIQADTNGDYLTFQFVLSGAITATVQVYTAYPQTGDNYARLGAPAGASVSADVAAVKSDSAAILVDTAEIGTAGVGLTNLGGSSNNWNTTTPPTVAAIADAVWDEAVAGHVSAGTFGATDAAILADTGELQTNQGNWLTATGFATAGDSMALTAAAVDAIWDEDIVAAHTTADTAGFKLAAAGGAADPWSTALPGAYGAGTAGEILGDWKNAGRLDTILDTIATDTTTDIPASIAALNDPTPAAIADAVLDEALSGHITAGTLGKALADVETDVTAILADTNELQTDDVPGLIAALNDPTAASIADAVLDEALAGHVTAGTLGKALADVETDATAILADTNELQTNQGNWATATTVTSVSGTVGGIAGTITTLDALDTAQDTQHSTTQASIAALNDIAVADILTTQMTEAYAADGVAPTLAQALFLIQQTIGDFAISGTTLTVKKLDGSTTAATYTLDSASAPTSRTRAT